jgi:hypothetical protein
VPRTVIPHARVLLRPEPDADLAGRVEQLTQTRADAVDSAAAELRRVSGTCTTGHRPGRSPWA